MSIKSPSVAAAIATSAKTVPAAAPGPTGATAPTPDEIATRAYELFQQEGGIDGHDMEHWLRAEEELKSTGKPELRAAAK